MSPAFLALSLVGCILWILVTGTYLRWHPLFSMLTATILYGVITGLPPLTLVEVMMQGFGSLVGSIGLIVVLGSILGVLLEDSGAVAALGRAIARESNRPSLIVAFLGMFVGIPVFCDSGFIVLFSLTKSLSQASQIPLSALSLSLAGGLYSSHTLIPPTPGPVAAAGNLGATHAIGLIMLMGLLVAIPVTLVAYFYSRFVGARLMTIETVNEDSAATPESKAGKAVMLILFPVMLIALGSVAQLLEWTGPPAEVLLVLGKPVVALLLGVGLAILLVRNTLKLTRSIDKGLRQSGPIILLTACGGSLGAVLKASPFAETVHNLLQGQQLTAIGFLLASFLIGAVFKIAQGSTTGAMIIASALLAPLAEMAGLNSSFDLSLLVLIIGAGAMVVSHANDSYFWVVSQFSGLSLRDGYRGITIMTLLQGLTALAVLLIIFAVSR